MNWLRIFDLFFIPVCVSCGRGIDNGLFLCRECKSPRYWISPFKAKQGLRPIDKAFYLWPYQSRFKPAIMHLKFFRLLPIASVLADLMADYVEYYKLSLDNFVVSYVPMHPVRRLLRGYNQARVLAELFADKTGLPVMGLLKTTRLSVPQHYIKDTKRRRDNVKNLFKASVLTGKMDVLLIDDVITSGNTIVECARQLKRNGANRVWVFGLYG